MGKIRQLGTITKHLKGDRFEVSLDENPNHAVLATPSGKIRIRRIALSAGDSVSVELSPYDLNRGRIIWRH